MNSNELPQQINQRCPCFAKPLNECDCQFSESEEEEVIPLAQREAEIRLIDKLLSYKDEVS